jgi:hypothetical protein
MPNWNGLGYQQLAQTRLSQKADRGQQGWMKFVDTMNKYFETQGAQQYELNQKIPLQQAGLEKIQGISDKAGLERVMADIKGADERQTATLKANADLRGLYDLTTGQQLSENAADRANQLAAQGQGKTPEPKDILGYLTSAGYLTGYGIGENGVFSGFASLADDSAGKRSAKISALRQAFTEETNGDPNQAKYLAAFDRMSKEADAGAAADDLAKKAGASKDAATKLVNMIKTNPLVGGIAEAVLAIFTTTKGGANVSAAKDWLNNWFPGRLGDKLFPIIGTASDPNRSFGIAPQKEAPASGQIPRQYQGR